MDDAYGDALQGCAGDECALVAVEGVRAVAADECRLQGARSGLVIPNRPQVLQVPISSPSFPMNVSTLGSAAFGQVPEFAAHVSGSPLRLVPAAVPAAASGQVGDVADVDHEVLSTTGVSADE